jgi:hypothetical protein
MACSSNGLGMRLFAAATAGMSMLTYLAFSPSAKGAGLCENPREGALSDVPFDFYKDASSGLRVDYPSTIFPTMVDIENGAGRKFASTDTACRFYISEGPNDVGATTSDIAALTKQYYSDRGATVTYERSLDRWYVISGVDHGDIYYEKGMLSPDGKVIGVLLVEYPQMIARSFEPIIRRMSRSFSMDGGEKVNGMSDVSRRDGVAPTGTSGSSETPISPTAPVVPRAGSYRLFLHFVDEGPENEARALAIAESMATAGYQIADIRKVSATTNGPRLRFFFAADSGGMPALTRDYAAALAKSGFVGGSVAVQNFEFFQPKPRPGTIELWLPNH